MKESEVNTYTLKSNPNTSTALEGWSLSNVAMNVKEGLLKNSKRGYKVLVSYGTRTCEEVCGDKHRVAVLTVHDTKLRAVEEVVVWEDEPAKAVTVRNPFDNSIIECKECAGDRFYAVGRSLDLNNWECRACGHISHTLTETGMSA